MERIKHDNSHNQLTELYDYQQADITRLFDRMEHTSANYKLLYQLPTGGGKTVIFSEIANRFIQKYHKKVMILTHRLELCKQTSATLKNLGIKNKIINSSVKRLSKREHYNCYVAMVETLNNRINEGLIDTSQIGLVIVDEAHHNSFQKLLDKFENATIIGVTATPYSSDISFPMHNTYNELIIGESIESLISRGFLAKPVTWRYDVELNTLQKSTHGDFTVSSSDELYSSPAMLELLLHAYEEHSKGKKTLVFNNGIFTSKAVCQMFNDAGYSARHLDNETSAEERVEILEWLKKTKGAILSSVSILTTGFDEPSVQTVILNRATTSLTLYHQMIGRGSRSLPKKKDFTIIDLGNNTDRFGDWSKPVDWQYIFDHPEEFAESIHAQVSESHNMPSEMRSKFPNSLELSFDIQTAYQHAIDNNQKPSVVITQSIEQHAQICADNSELIADAIVLTDELDKEIQWRIKQYGKCLGGKATKNYLEWLQEDYKAKLKARIQELKAPGVVDKVAV